VGKPKIACYWAASCGGCDVSVLDIGSKLADIVEQVEIVFWPIALDFKYKDVEAMPDQSIDICLFNGGIRNEENEHMAKLLRRKSKILIAYGACAYLGGILGLANLATLKELFSRVYRETPSTVNPENTVPQPTVKVKEGELKLSPLLEYLKPLNEVVEVDYYIPGCPPVGEKAWEALIALIKGEKPPKGTVLTADERTVCDSCPRVKEEKKIKELKRIYQVIPDPEKCFLEQGIICMGPATRGGCDAQCIKAGLPCKGCFGPAPNVEDQGARMLSALASIVEVNSEEEAKRFAESVADPAGTFYLFSLPSSMLKRRVK